MLKKINLGLVALVLGFGLTFSMSAFKSAEKSKFTRIWYFQSNNVTDAADASKYSDILPPPTSCNSGLDLPCYIQTPDDVDTQPELEAYISAVYHDDAQEVMNDTLPKREQL